MRVPTRILIFAEKTWDITNPPIERKPMFRSYGSLTKFYIYVFIVAILALGVNEMLDFYWDWKSVVEDRSV